MGMARMCYLGKPRLELQIRQIRRPPDGRFLASSWKCSSPGNWISGYPCNQKKSYSGSLGIAKVVNNSASRFVTSRDSQTPGIPSRI